MKSISGGATIWARKTIDSIIFYDKPDKWFKIWFFIVNKVNHKEHRKWKRGEGFMTYAEIRLATGASRDQVDKCLRYLKSSDMLSTSKTTRGMNVTVLKYAFYQDLNNYKSDTEKQDQAKQKRNRSDTINKNDKNDKNTSETSSPVTLEPLEENDTPSKKRKGDSARVQYEELCKWAEQRRGFKFVSRTKQYAALKKARTSEISITRLKNRWEKLENDEFFLDKGFDWTNVVSSFDKKA